MLLEMKWLGSKITKSKNNETKKFENIFYHSKISYK